MATLKKTVAVIAAILTTFSLAACSNADASSVNDASDSSKRGKTTLAPTTTPPAYEAGLYEALSEPQKEALDEAWEVYGDLPPEVISDGLWEIMLSVVDPVSRDIDVCYYYVGVRDPNPRVYCFTRGVKEPYVTACSNAECFADEALQYHGYSHDRMPIDVIIEVRDDLSGHEEYCYSEREAVSCD